MLETTKKKRKRKKRKNRADIILRGCVKQSMFNSEFIIQQSARNQTKPDQFMEKNPAGKIMLQRSILNLTETSGSSSKHLKRIVRTEKEFPSAYGVKRTVKHGGGGVIVWDTFSLIINNL